MSCCNKHICNRCEDESDYWFRTENYYHQRDRNFTPIFPGVVQANLIIPQTIIPIRIVFSPTITPFLGTQTAVAGATVPFNII